MALRFRLALLLLCAWVVVPATDSRPPCDKKHVGELWPTVANNNKAEAEKLVRCGELKVCTRTPSWRYRWDRLSVTLDQLKSKAKRDAAPSTCESPNT